MLASKFCVLQSYVSLNNGFSLTFLSLYANRKAKKNTPEGASKEKNYKLYIILPRRDFL